MTVVLPEVDTIAHLDFAHTPACDIASCHDNPDARPAVAILVEQFGCCDARRPICSRHRDLLSVLRDLHLTVVCSKHGTAVCAHQAFTLEPLP